MESFEHIQDFVRAMGFDFPPDCHLVLDVKHNMPGQESMRYWCGYYFVSHSTHSVYWLEKTDISELFMGDEHVSEARVSEFWDF